MKRNFYTLNGRLFANDYSRVVIGAQGPYIEFDQAHLVNPLECEPGEEYRGKGRYKYCKYSWLRPIGDSSVKVYHQLRTVNYADYKVGMYYVSPTQLLWDDIAASPLYAEIGLPGQVVSTRYVKEQQS